MNFYVSDYHFGHENVIKFDNRPFKNLDKMNNFLIENWNKTINENDKVFILGDFSFYKEEKTLEILKSLKGKKFLIKGNHDKISPKISKALEGRFDYLETIDCGEKIVLSHYPMPFWNGQFRNSIHLYGHVHATEQHDLFLKFLAQTRDAHKLPFRAFNVGCMLSYMDYTPRTLEEILKAN